MAEQIVGVRSEHFKVGRALNQHVDNSQASRCYVRLDLAEYLEGIVLCHEHEETDADNHIKVFTNPVGPQIRDFRSNQQLLDRGSLPDSPDRSWTPVDG